MLTATRSRLSGDLAHRRRSYERASGIPMKAAIVRGYGPPDVVGIEDV
jgi:hypothetical protein